MNPQSPSPLALAFEEAIVPSRFLAQITSGAEAQILSEIASLGNRALGLGLATAKVALNGGTVQVVFEQGIPAGAKLMNAAGKRLPVLVDGRTGRVLQLGRIAKGGRVAASTAVNAALVLVEVAHLISDYDNAQRLKAVERGVERLIAAEESELRARLEAIYRYSKELLHSGPDALSDEDRRELHRQSRELFELRARWRDNFRYELSQLNEAKPGLLNQVFVWRKKTALEKSKQQRASQAADALQEVQLMHFSLMLQMALAGCAGRLDAFQQLTLADECAAWRSLVSFAEGRAEKIAGANDPALESFLGALRDLSDYWGKAHVQYVLPAKEANLIPSETGAWARQLTRLWQLVSSR